MKKYRMSYLAPALNYAGRDGSSVFLFTQSVFKHSFGVPCSRSVLQNRLCRSALSNTNTVLYFTLSGKDYMIIL